MLYYYQFEGDKFMKKVIIGFFVVCLFIFTDAYAKVIADIPENPQRALIIIHGYGGNGNSMRWMTNNLKKALPDMAFYYPTAPDKSPYGGYQWFQIPTLGSNMSKKDLYDIMMADAIKNVNLLHRLVEEIHDELGISYQNIYVSGFSQGGLMALLTTLTSSHSLPIAVSFSGVPLLFTKDFMPSQVKNKPDILLLKGDNDSAIPQDSIDLTTSTLAKLQIKPEVKIFKGMSHQINQSALQTAIEFMK